MTLLNVVHQMVARMPSVQVVSDFRVGREPIDDVFGLNQLIRVE